MRTRPLRRPPWWLIAFSALVLAAAGCADDPEADAPAEEPEEAEDEPDEAEDEADEVTVAVADGDLGTVLVDGDGMTLYAFTPDADGEPTCYDECAEAWPPLLVDEAAEAGDGADADLLGSVDRDDDTTQVTYGDWPLYLWANDESPGDVTGQGVNDEWYVVDPDGELIEAASDAPDDADDTVDADDVEDADANADNGGGY